MNIIPFKGKFDSGNHKLNLLFNEGKSYIMDNHLAASWCWMQKISADKRYNIFHIDRHYDLLDSQTDWWLEELQKQKFDFTTASIEDLLAIKYSHPSSQGSNYPLFRWDNYLVILNRIYPELINEFHFATHKDGDAIDELDLVEYEVYELPQILSFKLKNNAKSKWIVNVDIDYFFSDREEQFFQLLTDDYVLAIADEIKKAWDNIEVFTIALSPELCGGWDNSLRVAKIITEHLQLEFEVI